MKNLSLKYKLFFVLSLTVLLYAVFSALFVNFYLKNLLKKHFVDMGKVLTATVSNRIVNDLLIKNFVEIVASFDGVMKNNPDVSYLFIEKDGHVLLHTFREGFPIGLLNIGHKKNETDYVLVETGNGSYYDFSTPIFREQTGTLRIGMSVRNIEKTLNNANKSLLYVALASVAATLVFSIIISKKLIKPLSMLTDSATEIANGDYSKTIQTYDSDDEVGKLTEVFNKMINAIKLRENQLRETNEDLEVYGVKLFEYIEELNRTKDELVKSKQDQAVVQTSKAMLHHVRQPLTYLVMAIEIFTDELQEGKNLNTDEILKKLRIVEAAGNRVTEILKKFEKLKEYKSYEFSDSTKIIDIEE